LKGKSTDDINKLYRASQYLKIKGLKRCVAAAVACQVYIKPTLEEYNKKRGELSTYYVKIRHHSSIDC